MSDAEEIRLRPGRFIGGTESRGMHRLLWTLVESAEDETPLTQGKLVEIVIHYDNSLTFSDHGRGVLVGPVSGTDVPALTAVLTALPLPMRESPPAEPADGFVPLVVVNALSAWLRAENRQDSTIYRQEFAKGKPTTSLLSEGKRDPQTGLTITFLPDPEIFDATPWSLSQIQQRLKATESRGLRTRVTDQRMASQAE